MDKYFLVQIKRTNGTIEKGVVVKDSYNAALQSYFAYLGAYGYGKDGNTDYVSVAIIDPRGLMVEGRVDDRTNVAPEPTPEPEPEPTEEAGL